MAHLCTTVTAPTMAELRARRDAAAAASDLVELRLDTVDQPDVAAALHGRRGPVIVTCRARWEGGHFTGSEAERHRLLAEAWQAGAEYVDVEWAAWQDAPWTAATGGRRLIVSSHDFHGVPADLRSMYGAMVGTGAQVVKIAITSRRLNDCAALLDLGPRPGRRDVLLAMGVPGFLTRALPDRFGSAWTYTGEGVAPGQVSSRRLRQEFRFGEVSPDAALYGLIANPVGHSISPAMHNAAFRAAGLDAVYLPLQAADAEDVLAIAPRIGLQGASVTVPFKVQFLPHTIPDPLAARVGAVNTLRWDADGLHGRNTDVEGLLGPLARLCHIRGLRVTILGAGGAARGAAIALIDAGAHVTICARRAGPAAAVARETGAQVSAMPPEPGSWDVLVNATPAGMYPAVDETPWAAGRFDGSLVYDLIYNPPETRLLREARAAGCPTLGGLEMLVAQAEAQFQFWTGQVAPPGVMHRAAVERLAEFASDDRSDSPVATS